MPNPLFIRRAWAFPWLALPQIRSLAGRNKWNRDRCVLWDISKPNGIGAERPGCTERGKISLLSVAMGYSVLLPGAEVYRSIQIPFTEQWLNVESPLRLQDDSRWFICDQFYRRAFAIMIHCKKKSPSWTSKCILSKLLKSYFNQNKGSNVLIGWDDFTYFNTTQPVSRDF